jgi:hypothetical protein
VLAEDQGYCVELGALGLVKAGFAVDKYDAIYYILLFIILQEGKG